MDHATMSEAARQMPHMMSGGGMSEMMKPVVTGAGGYLAARAIAGNPLLGALRSPLLLLAAGAAAGYFVHKYRREILGALLKASDAGKDFVLQQKESLSDLVAEAKESGEAQAKAASAADTGEATGQP
jgi:hypothetical protein